MARLFPPTLSFLAFLFILLHTNLLACNSQTVLDINGDIVRVNLDYVIAPSGGGNIVLRSSAPNHTCPLDVVFRNITDIAIPVRFSPKNSKDIFFNVGTDVNIEFDVSTICVTSTVWRIQSNVSSSTGIRYFVTTGGVKGNETSWFQIESSSDDSEIGNYVIHFCSTVCKGCRPRPECGYIGLILENGRTRLGITSPPLQVSFVPFLSSSVALTESETTGEDVN